MKSGHLSPQVDGGSQEYEADLEWKANKVVASRVKSGTIQYLINWDGYDQTYDTWEDPENLLDKQLLRDFNSNRTVKVDTEQAMWELREGEWPKS